MTPQTGTIRISTRTLLLLFIAALALTAGAFNLRDRLNQKPAPTDGVLWKDDARFGVVAEKVEPGSPASQAGIMRGDVLAGICTTGDDNYEEIKRAEHVQIYLDTAKDLVHLGNPLNLSYLIERWNDTGEKVIFEGYADLQELPSRETNQTRGLYLTLIGLIYLGLGIYFLLKQGRAPYATHFFLLCLLAFIAHSY
ncbi:MAG: hypothetical protein ACREEM_21745, partial [Blastocatellia bacterium]